MSNIKSSKKRILINIYRNKINNIRKNIIKNYIKKIKYFIKKKNKKYSLINFYKFQSILDKLYIKKFISLSKCSKYKSILFKLINKL